MIMIMIMMVIGLKPQLEFNAYSILPTTIMLYVRTTGTRVHHPTTHHHHHVVPVPVSCIYLLRVHYVFRVFDVIMRTNANEFIVQMLHTISHNYVQYR